MARWCTSHRRSVVLGWWGAFVLLVSGVAAFGTDFHDSSQLPASDSATASTLLAQAGSAGRAAGESGGGNGRKTGTVVWATTTGSATSHATRTVVDPMLRKIEATSGVTSVGTPFTTRGKTQVSPNGQVAYATVSFSTTAAATKVKSIAESTTTSALQVEVGGQGYNSESPSEVSDIFGVAAALLVLFLVFRSRRAAFLPIITGVSGVAVSSVAVLLLSHVIALSSVSLSLGVLIGLGVGIDYALLIANRHIRALREGVDVQEAIITAMDTSGRSVIFAGGTVIAALLGMVILGFGFLSGMGMSAAVTVLVTVAAAITLLPAMLVKAGPRVLPRAERSQWAPGKPIVSAGSAHAVGGVWGRWALLVQRRPVAISLAAVAIMVVLAAPVTSLRLGSADQSSDPTSTTARTFYDVMASGFGKGYDSDLTVVASTPDAASRTAWAGFVQKLPAVADVQSVTPSTALGDDQIATVTIQPKTAAQDAATSDLVKAIRASGAQAEVGTHLQVHVGGSTASDIDYANALIAKLPLYLVIIAAIGFVLLTVALRSLVVPAIGVLSNLLTIGVALGVTVALFQWGWGPSFLGIGGPAPVEYIVVMLIVGVIFGLSMDYQVFLLSRIREEWILTGDNDRAVSVGVAQTGKVIATAAAIMFCVFASFGFSGTRISSEFGVGLALAVLADAFLMRLTIIPALTRVLGRSNWALPAWLDRVLPNLSIDGPPQATVAAAVAPDPEPVPTAAS